MIHFLSDTLFGFLLSNLLELLKLLSKKCIKERIEK